MGAKIVKINGLTIMKSYKIKFFIADAIESKVISESLKVFKKTEILVNVLSRIR